MADAAATDERVDTDAPAMLCPACGYDLRGMAGDRCSECGLVIDREALRESGFAWAHRGRIGRIRAYLRTVWQVSAGGRALGYEAAKPQRVADGRAFRWVTAGVVAAALLEAWAWVVISEGGVMFMAYDPARSLATRGTPMPVTWVMDFAAPWSAGVTMVWMAPGCLLLLAGYVAGVQPAVLRVSGFAEEYRVRVAAIGHYTSAPLALLLPVPVCWALAVVVYRWPHYLGLTLGLAAMAGLFFIGGMGLSLWRVGQWAARVRHGGVGSAVAAAGELVGLWLLGVVLILGAVPWCVGFVYIAVDGFW